MLVTVSGRARAKEKAEGGVRRASKRADAAAAKAARSPKLRTGQAAAKASSSTGSLAAKEGPAESVSTVTTKLPRWKRSLRHTPLLLLCHNRPEFLDRTLSAIFKHHPGDGLVPIVISEDGSHPRMDTIIEKHRSAPPSVADNASRGCR